MAEEATEQPHAAPATVTPDSEGSPLEVLAVSARLGLTSFGGPVAHLGYFRTEYVERRRWLDERTYADLVALCQFLPGPASSQVGIAIGITRAGLLGGLMAWLGFTFPSALALMLFALGVRDADLADAGWLHGLKVVAVAVVAQAVWGMARQLAPDRPRATLAILAAIAVLAWGSPLAQLLAIVVAGLIGWRFLPVPVANLLLHRRAPIGRGLAVTCWFAFFGLLVGLPLLRQLTGSHTLALFDSFYRAGSLVFGGGHVVLPLLQAEIVPPGWVTADQFIAGYGAAQAVPGPLFTFATYLGAVAAPTPNGIAGAALALVAIFSPSFLLVVGALPFWDALRARPAAQSALRGVNAAVVGILLAALYDPVWTSAIGRPLDLALALAAFGLLQFWKAPPGSSSSSPPSPPPPSPTSPPDAQTRLGQPANTAAVPQIITPYGKALPLSSRERGGTRRCRGEVIRPQQIFKTLLYSPRTAHGTAAHAHETNTGACPASQAWRRQSKLPPLVVWAAYRHTGEEDRSMASGQAQARREPPIQRVIYPVTKFMHAETSGGIVLIICALIALIWANSPWSASYHDLWQVKLTVGVPGFGLSETLIHWINDGLMAVFFFVVGLEIKREVLVGELASPRQAALPIAAAIGGMVVPAGLYVLINAGGAGAGGWGIPMATDIAFSLGVLALLGTRAPTGLKIFLTALAIVDDLGAVLVIALFYTAQISWVALGVGAIFFSVLILANVLQVRHPFVYAILGLGLWVAFLQSGVHATIAGVLLALTIPARTRVDTAEFLTRGRELLDEFDKAGVEGRHILTNGGQQAVLAEMEALAEGVQTPLQRLEHSLHPWVAFAIVPLFALANAGVTLSGGIGAALTQSVTLGVIAGLILGKQIGVTAGAWLAVRLGLADLPHATRWRHIYGAAWLAGIGFTMSLFIGSLAFGDGQLLDDAKIGILAASLVSGLGGWLLLRFLAPDTQPIPQAIPLRREPGDA